MRQRIELLILPALFAAARALAQAPPLGTEFQINSYTTGRQDNAAVASRGDGSFVVVWRSDGKDGDKTGVFGQRFDVIGEKVGGEFQINAYTIGYQGSPAIAAASDGSFIVVWESYPQEGPNVGVFGQRFNALGTKLGGEFHVNTYTTGDQFSPAIAMDAGGNFVVVWTSKGQEGFYDEGIFGQRFDSVGARTGGEFHVNTYTLGDQRSPSIAMSPSGAFVVAWDSRGQDGLGTGVFGQRFDASGGKTGPEFQVNTYTTGYQDEASVTMDRAGNFVVAWQGPKDDYFSPDLFVQRFNSGGERVGPETHINTQTSGTQAFPSIVPDGSGGFVVAWSSPDGGGALPFFDAGTFVRRFDRNANAAEPEFQMNTYTTAAQTSPKIANDGLGFVVVWQGSGQDGSDYGIFGRRQNLHAEGLAVDSASTSETISDANGVLEPGETTLVAPSWSNAGASPVALTGSTPLTFCFLGFPCVAAADLSADYGSLPPEAIASCNDGSPTACYTVSASGPRPATHWDGSFIESLSSGGSQLWTLHVGDSFSDVPRSEPFYRKIETLLHHGITSGCTTTTYCPTVPVPRDQMAIFIAKGIAGLGEYVPTTGTLNGLPYNCSPGGVSRFSDVSPTDPACRHVHYLGVQNVTLGCSATKYCPGDVITRDAMASFIAKAVVAPQGGAGVPMSYSDPDTGRSYSCTVGSPNIHFTDVPVSNTFCRHIHFVWAKGIVSGCSATKYCPSQSVNRDAMAKFLANGFNLQLYGP